MVGFVRRGRGRGPTISATPPPARRMPTIGGDRPPPPVKRRTPGEPGRVVAVFGPPGTGIDRVLRILHEESTTPTAHIVAGDRVVDLVAAAVEHAQKESEVVFLEGVPRTPADVQWLYDRRFVSPAGGTLVRVACNTVVNPAFDRALVDIEQAVIGLALPYTLVFVDDPAVAATNLFNIAGLT